MEGHLIDGELTRSVIGAFYDVYNALGFGFLEHVYMYLRATNIEVGLLLHFGPSPGFFRLISSNRRSVMGAPGG